MMVWLRNYCFLIHITTNEIFITFSFALERFESERHTAMMKLTRLSPKNSVETFPQKCRRLSQPAECSRKSAGHFRYQRNVHAEVQDVSARGGLFLQKWLGFPLAAECPCRSAGRFRWLQTFPQKCRRLLNVIYFFLQIGGAIRWLRKRPPDWRSASNCFWEVKVAVTRVGNVVEVLYIICRKASKQKKSSKQDEWNLKIQATSQFPCHSSFIYSNLALRWPSLLSFSQSIRWIFVMMTQKLSAFLADNSRFESFFLILPGACLVK